MYCQNPECNTEIQNRYKYCPQCGGSNFAPTRITLETPDNPPLSESVEAPDRLSVPLWYELRQPVKIVGLIIFLTCLAFAIFQSTSSLEINATAHFDDSWDKIVVDTVTTQKTMFGDSVISPETEISVTNDSGYVFYSGNSNSFSINERSTKSQEPLTVSACAKETQIIGAATSCHSVSLISSEKKLVQQTLNIKYPTDPYNLDSLEYEFELASFRKKFDNSDWEKLGLVDSPIQIQMWADGYQDEALKIEAQSTTLPQIVSLATTQNWGALNKRFDALREAGGDLPVNIVFAYQGGVSQPLKKNIHFKSKEERIFEQFPVLGAALQIQKSPEKYQISVEEISGKIFYCDINRITVDETNGRSEILFDYRGGTLITLYPSSKNSPHASGTYKLSFLFASTNVSVDLNFYSDGTAKGEWNNMSRGFFNITKK
jgi:hypothetical protein